MRNKNTQTGSRRGFWLALFLTLLAAAALCGILLALVRMEGTMHSGDFTLFSLRPDRENGLLELTALDRYYLLGFSGAERLAQGWEQASACFPAEWRAFLGLLGQISGEIGRFVGKFL